MLRLHQVYFSPTGTTRKIVSAIAEGMAVDEIICHDLTLQPDPLELSLKEGMAIIAVPVYAGRVPELFLQRIGTLSAAPIPAVLVVVYGNREFEDALVELQDLVEARGFRVIAAAAFIGEHSYSTPLQPIAAGRPDEADLLLAREFGSQIGRLPIPDSSYGRPVIPGNRPYRERPARGPMAPVVDPQRCTGCAACLPVCPTAAITPSGAITATDASACILCCACSKICPHQARSFEYPMIVERRAMLVANCSQRKEPVTFIGRGR